MSHLVNPKTKPASFVAPNPELSVTIPNCHTLPAVSSLPLLWFHQLLCCCRACVPSRAFPASPPAQPALVSLAARHPRLLLLPSPGRSCAQPAVPSAFCRCPTAHGREGGTKECTSTNCPCNNSSPEVAAGSRARCCWSGLQQHHWTAAQVPANCCTSWVWARSCAANWLAGKNLLMGPPCS